MAGGDCNPLAPIAEIATSETSGGSSVDVQSSGSIDVCQPEGVNTCSTQKRGGSDNASDFQTAVSLPASVLPTIRIGILGAIAPNHGEEGGRAGPEYSFLRASDRFLLCSRELELKRQAPRAS